MKKIILIMFLTSGICFNAQAQIKLEEIRQSENRERIVQKMKEEDSSENTNEEVYQENKSLMLTSEQKQKAKINNLSSIIIMNAAIVGYGTSCGFNSQNIQRIESYFLKQYNISGEPLVLAKYREKVGEFKLKKPTDKECRIFFKDFSLILKDVTKKM